jgi:hypothetical protein
VSPVKGSCVRLSCLLGRLCIRLVEKIFTWVPTVAVRFDRPGYILAAVSILAVHVVL